MLRAIAFNATQMMQSYEQISKYQFDLIIDVVGTFNVLKDGFIDLFFFIGVMALWAFRGVEVIWPAFVFAKVGKQGVH